MPLPKALWTTAWPPSAYSDGANRGDSSRRRVSRAARRSPVDVRSIVGGLANHGRISWTNSSAADEDHAIRWKAMSPLVRREAVEVLFSRSEGIEALLGAIESHLLAPSEIDLARLQQLQKHSNPSFRLRAQKILDSGAVPSRDRAQVIEKYRLALGIAGKREDGRGVFARICASCHQAEGRGVDVGPNLATVSNRSEEDLLVHILDPNREVAPNFVNYNVATVEGRVISGIITEESANAIILKRSEGANDVIPRDQIETVQSTGVSLMPEGLEKGLSVQDFADLIAFSPDNWRDGAGTGWGKMKTKRQRPD